MSRNTLELTYSCNLKISQIESAIRNVITAAKKIVSNLNPNFEFGPITARDGVSYGKGFLYFKDHRIVFLLEGKDVDGRDRYIEVQSTEEPVANEPVADFRPSFSGSWGDYEDDEQIASKNLKRERAPPLIEFEELELEAGETYSINFSRIPAIEDVPDCKSSHVLKCYNLLDNEPIDINYIRGRLSIFSNDSKYPQIILKKNNMKKNTLYVIFDPRTDDASFCKLVRHKLELSERRTLIFSYAESTEADIVKKSIVERVDRQPKKIPRPGTAPKQPAIRRTKEIALSKSTGNIFDILGDSTY